MTQMRIDTVSAEEIALRHYAEEHGTGFAQDLRAFFVALDAERAARIPDPDAPDPRAHHTTVQYDAGCAEHGGTTSPHCPIDGFESPDPDALREAVETFLRDCDKSDECAAHIDPLRATLAVGAPR